MCFFLCVFSGAEHVDYGMSTILSPRIQNAAFKPLFLRINSQNKIFNNGPFISCVGKRGDFERPEFCFIHEKKQQGPHQNPSWLFQLLDCTTQLYGDYNKPLWGSLISNSYNGMP